MSPIRLLLGTLALALGVSGLLPGASARADGETLPSLTQVAAADHQGARRFGRTVKVSPGQWSPAPATIGYQWLRDGTPIAGATRRKHTVGVDDVGHRLDVVITVTAPGHAATSVSHRIGRAKHRVDTRRTVRYSVRTRGNTGGASLQGFRQLAQETLDDPRGWRARGVRFVPVKRGGAFTLWLSQASLVPSFSSQCSSQWSCRVGRNVIINVVRWQSASPAWNGAGRSLRDYRHMVVNHEVGHFLGRGHVGCPRRGALAPVMMQQSKGTQGCRFNPWPTPGELGRR